MTTANTALIRVPLPDLINEEGSEQDFSYLKKTQFYLIEIEVKSLISQYQQIYPVSDDNNHLCQFS